MLIKDEYMVSTFKDNTVQWWDEENLFEVKERVLFDVVLFLCIGGRVLIIFERNWSLYHFRFVLGTNSNKFLLHKTCTGFLSSYFIFMNEIL